MRVTLQLGLEARATARVRGLRLSSLCRTLLPTLDPKQGLYRVSLASVLLEPAHEGVVPRSELGLEIKRKDKG